MDKEPEVETVKPKVEVHFDGLCEPINPGGYGSWGLAILLDGNLVERRGGFLGRGCTNNIAEYNGAIEAVRLANSLYPNERKVLKGDSQLVIRQLQGLYKVRSPRIAPLYETLKVNLNDLWTFEWIPREENEIADFAARQAIWQAIGKWPHRGYLSETRP